MWRVEVEDPAYGVTEAVDGALGGFAQVSLELGEGLLDRVEVGAIRGEVEQLRARPLDSLLCGGMRLNPAGATIAPCAPTPNRTAA